MSADKVEAGIVPTTDPEALKETVRKQVEFYFSKENLANDGYLMKLMDKNMSAPISAIMKFAKISALTTDEAVLRNSLINSTLVSIVDDRIKTTAKTGNRATIILREIPSDVPESEVRAIFDFDSCKPIHSVRSDVGDTWFVVMESEEDAKDTLLDLKLKKRLFKGAGVKCRLKSEASIPRSYYPAPSAGGGGSPGNKGPNGGPGAPMHNMMMQGGGPMGGMPNQRFPYNNGMSAPPMMGGNMGGNFPMNPMSGFPNSDNAHSPDARPSGPDSNQSSPAKHGGNSEHSPSTRHNNNEKSEGRKGKASGNNNSERKNTKNADSAGAAAAAGGAAPGGKIGNRKIEMNSSNFPPLAEGAIPANNPACNPAFAGIPVNTPGFKAPFHQYSYDEIISIVRGVQDATLPVNDDKPPQYSQIMDSTPNLDLLHRQRTFSIDETREQLDQGRPVQREAVMGGSIENTVSYSKKSGGGNSSGGQQKTAAKVKSGESTLNPSASSFSYASIVKTDAAPVPSVPAKPKADPAKTDATKKPDAGKATRKADKDDSSASGEAVTGDKSASGPATPGREKKRREPRSEQEGAAAAAAPATTPPAASTGWGGKASFANIVKVAAADEPEGATLPAPRKPEPKPDSKASNSAATAPRDKKERPAEKNMDKSKANAMSGGMWSRNVVEK